MTFAVAGKLTGSTRALLRSLSEPDSLICFVATRDGSDMRFYFQRGPAYFLVQERAVQALAERGYILRCSSQIPIYRITQKGRAYLRVASGKGF